MARVTSPGQPLSNRQAQREKLRMSIPNSPDIASLTPQQVAREYLLVSTRELAWLSKQVLAAETRRDDLIAMAWSANLSVQEIADHTGLPISLVSSIVVDSE